MRIIAVINQKGGVGKTTTCVNLAHALALAGHKVIALDMDPQGHLAASFGFNEIAGPTIDAALLEGRPLAEALLPARDDLLIIPAGGRLIELEHQVSGGVERGRRLQRALEQAGFSADFLLIDCPPSSGLLAINALFAARELLVPMPGEWLALHGLSQLLRVLQSVQRLQQREIPLWVALTRQHPRRALTRQVLGKLMQYFPNRVLATPIRETSALAEAPSVGKSIFEYRPASHGAEDYRDLARDLLEARTIVWQK